MPASPDPLRGALDALSEFLIGSQALGDTLRHVAQLTVDAYDAAAYAGISTLVDGAPRTAVFTDELAPQIDAAQYEVGTGPCLDSFRDGVVYRIDDTETEARWPDFAQAALAHGVRSTISFPMIAGNEPTGVLNLYSREPSGFRGADEALGLTLSRQAAVLLANSRVYWDAQELGEHLQEAMRSRATIEQAKGIIMAGSRCTPDEAFATLSRASQRENVKLRDIAQRIVDRARHPDPG